MPAAVALTLSEASTILSPPMTAEQLRKIVTALGWQPEGWRRTGRPGHPAPCYSATRIMQLHQALVPFNDGLPYAMGRRQHCPESPRREPMDPAVQAAMLEHFAAQHDADTWVQARIPFNGGNLDGAVVELHLHPDEGIFTGEVRIPGPPRP